MKHFKYENATSFDEVKDIVNASEGKSVVMAGGTDLLGVLKGKLLPEYPETVVSLKEVPDTEYIKDEGDVYKIGAMTTLSTIERDEALKEALPAVGQAARSVASPLIRNRATIGGNLCQDVRCWFYRYPDIAGGILNCARKGGNECYAIRGDNRYHSIFGGMKTGLTPCSTECPAGTDIPGYMAKFREGDIEGAATILMQYNPLPMMTSRVCAHTCQTKCNRCTTDENVSIHSVERVLGDYIMEHLDILCPFGFARMPDGDLTGKEAANMLQKVCDEAKAHLWFDLEVFLFNPDNSLYPRPVEEIIRDLNLFDNFEKILCYQFPGVFNDPKMSIRVGEARTIDLFNGYMKYLKELKAKNKKRK